MSGRAHLQWGGRFGDAPDPALLAFGSSLADDLVLAPFDVACSRAHVVALAGGGIIPQETATVLDGALRSIAEEVQTEAFAGWALALGAEDVHGAIDARVRSLEPVAGEWLHAGRSRNDQVATTLLLYARDRARRGHALCVEIARLAVDGAAAALEKGTLLAATTHWQPAQPVLLAFWLAAVAENFVRAAQRFDRVAADAARWCPLGSAACAGSTLPLDRLAAARALGFAAPSRNALDAIGDRDVALDLLAAAGRALLAASRVSEEVVAYCTPAFGYARLADSASTGSSLMPQKRNPDPFELVRGAAGAALGAVTGAQATLAGLALSYHRDLQETKRIVVFETERALGALDAFSRAFSRLSWQSEAMEAAAAEGFTVATDIADALVARGVTPRRAHELVGRAVAAADRDRRALNEDDLIMLASAARIPIFDAPLDAGSSVLAKRTAGSTSPADVRRSLEALRAELDASDPQA